MNNKTRDAITARRRLTDRRVAVEATRLRTAAHELLSRAVAQSAPIVVPQIWVPPMMRWLSDMGYVRFACHRHRRGEAIDVVPAWRARLYNEYAVTDAGRAFVQRGAA